MQKIVALSVLFIFTLTAFGQSPFTITPAGFPFFGIQHFNQTNNPTGLNLTPSADGDWNFSNYHSSQAAVNNYVLETDPFYTNQGIDVYIDNVKSLTQALGYAVFYEIDFNDTGVYEDGIYVPEQGYGLSAFTGNTLDSITFPLQGSFFQGGRKLMQFPATYQSAWQSESHRAVNFNLTVTAAGLNKTPFQHAFTVFRTDTIIGWGKMRVYANGIPSIPYDVLIDQSRQYTVDSFYLGGAPAPASLLAGFGMVQGQQTSVTNRYTAFRMDNSTPLVVINYAANNFTTPSQIFADTDDLSTSGVEAPAHENYSTLLFPNPSTFGALTLQMSGDIPATSIYHIRDRRGRTVQSGPANLIGGALQLRLDQQLPFGNYILQVLDEQNTPLITEQFVHGQ